MVYCNLFYIFHIESLFFEIHKNTINITYIAYQSYTATIIVMKLVLVVPLLVLKIFYFLSLKIEIVT